MNAHFAEAHIERRKRLGMYTPQPVIARPKKRDIIHIEPTEVEQEPEPITEEQIENEFFRLAHMPDWKRICVEVCYKHKVTMVELTSECRSKEIVAARYEAAYRLRYEAGLSSSMIGRRLGGRDHTTILYALKRYEEKIRNSYPRLPE